MKTLCGILGLVASIGVSSFADNYYVKNSRIIVEGRGVHDFMRPHTIEINDGIWLLAYSKSDQHAPKTNDGTIHFRFSEDEGRTWTSEDRWLDGTSVKGVPDKPLGALWSCYAIRFPNGDIVIYPVDITENYYDDFWTIRSKDNFLDIAFFNIMFLS